MKRVRTLDSWYKPVVATENPSVNNDQAAEPDEMQVPEPEQNQSAHSKIEQDRVLTTSFERDHVNANKFGNSCRRNKMKLYNSIYQKVHINLFWKNIHLKARRFIVGDSVVIGLLISGG